MPGCTWQPKSPLQLKPVFRFCSWKQSCSLGNVVTPVIALLSTLENPPQTWSSMFTANQLTREGLLLVRKHFWVPLGPMSANGFLAWAAAEKVFSRSLHSPSAVGPHIGRYCGQKTPGRILSSSGILSMVFYTDSAIAKEGFSANYSVLQSSVSEGQYSRLLQSPALNILCASSSHACGSMKH